MNDEALLILKPAKRLQPSRRKMPPELPLPIPRPVSSDRAMTKSDSLRDAILVAAWPFSVMSLSLWGRALFGTASIVDVLMALGLLLPIPLFLIRARRLQMAWHELIRPLRHPLYMVLFIVWLAGSIAGVAMGYALPYTLLTILAFLAAAFYTKMITPGTLNLGCGIYSLASAVVMFLIASTSTVTGRAISGFGLNPNALGFFCMSAGSFALCWKNPIMRYGIIVLSAIPIFIVSSRASLLGLIVAVVAYAFLGLSGIRLYRRFAAVALAGSVIFALWYAPIAESINEAFALDDPHRGLHTGFTGRTERWAAGWKLFRNHPILGVGFRSHMEALKGIDVHNGFLAYLSETGIMGSLAAAALFAVATRNTWKRSGRSHFDRVLLSASTGYLAHSVFERFIFNIGNPGSLLFILWVVYGVNRTRKRRSH